MLIGVPSLVNSWMGLDVNTVFGEVGSVSIGSSSDSKQPLDDGACLHDVSWLIGVNMTKPVVGNTLD